MVENVQDTALLVATICAILVWVLPEEAVPVAAKVIIMTGLFGGVATAVVTAFIRIWQ